MDLSKLDMKEAASRGATMQLRHPSTGEALKSDDGKPITIDLLGSDSAEYRNQIKQAATRGAARGRKRPSVEVLEQEGIALLAACTRNWANMQFNGEKLKFSQAAAQELYEGQGWIREQVDDFISERGNFLASA